MYPNQDQTIPLRTRGVSFFFSSLFAGESQGFFLLGKKLRTKIRFFISPKNTFSLFSNNFVVFISPKEIFSFWNQDPVSIPPKGNFPVATKIKTNIWFKSHGRKCFPFDNFKNQDFFYINKEIFSFRTTLQSQDPVFTSPEKIFSVSTKM